MTNFARARSSEQKEERMQEIKRAAETQFSRRTYQSITLSTIAEELSWSRANLYKYVTSKEEIFLELSADKCSEYLGALKAAFPSGCGYSAQVGAKVWAGILSAHADYLKYSALLSSIIETNVTVERLAVFKKQFHEQVDEFTALLHRNYQMTEDEAYWLFMTVHYHGIGLYSYCNASPLVMEALELAGVHLEIPDFRMKMEKFIYINLKNVSKGEAF